jgi:signal transduction histidine kinase
MKLTTHYYRHILPIVLLLFLATIVASYFLIRRTLRRELDYALLRSKSRIESYTRRQHRLPEVTSFDDQLVRFSPGRAPQPTVFSDTMQYISEQKKEHISRKLTFSLLLDGQSWDVSVSQPLEGTRHLTILIAEIAITTLSVTMFLFILVNRRLLKRLWRPFYQSLDLIRSFKVDEPARSPYPDSAIEEFRLMNKHFEQAADNASRDYRNLKEFSENASHELQTPLAILRSNLDLLAQEVMTQRGSELMQAAYRALRRTSHLHESLLLLTRIDNRQFTRVDDVRIDLLLADKVLQLQEMLSANGIVCRVDLEQTSRPANRELMDILLNNLFSNAIRHNRENGEIHAKVKANYLRVSNTGPGRALDSSRLFRRFYKDSEKTANNGLGLSIVKQICDTTAMQVQYVFAEGWHTFTVSW